MGTDSQLMAASSTSTLVGSTISTGNGNGSTGNTNSVNSQLEKAESKISELLKVKEKFAEVSAENSTLAMNLSEMQQEMNLMTRTATACALIPLAVVLLAMFAYYFPFFGFLEEAEVAAVEPEVEDLQPSDPSMLHSLMILRPNLTFFE